LHLGCVFIIIEMAASGYHAAASAGFPRHVDEGQSDIRDSGDRKGPESSLGVDVIVPISSDKIAAAPATRRELCDEVALQEGGTTKCEEVRRSLRFPHCRGNPPWEGDTGGVVSSPAFQENTQTKETGKGLGGVHMETEKTAETFTKELEDLTRKKMGAIFGRYGLDLEDLLTPLKWKPLVLIIGNYSSGKSTFINEILETELQRTGQAPTDDCFTVITAPEGEESSEQVPGGTIVSDERLPFDPLRRFGESLLSHFKLKRVDSPAVQELAIIDTPGMLDSVTEKDRGYDYLGVVGELARLADLIILMFDPHKAGTIKETYQAIRTTLPGSTGEDRILFVMNRIDECETMPDLVKAYGTLCWNLSQMTGRKDIPRIYLTFAPKEGVAPPGFEIWTEERLELKQAVFSAPRMRLNHILQEVDRGVRELALELEALASFRNNFGRRLREVAKASGLVALAAFFLGDVSMKLLTGYPEHTLVGSMLARSAAAENLLWPVIGVLLVAAATSLYVQRILFPKFKKQTLEDLDSLIEFDTAYKKDLWRRVRSWVHTLISTQARRHVLIAHGRNLARIERFLEKDLSAFYERIRTTKA
jgi:EH domain-containing protein 1